MWPPRSAAAAGDPKASPMVSKAQKRELQSKEPESIEMEFRRNIRTKVGIFLSYSYYVLGVPDLVVPMFVPLDVQVPISPKTKYFSQRFLNSLMYNPYSSAYVLPIVVLVFHTLRVQVPKD